MMKRNSVLWLFSLSLSAFLGCDYVESRALDRERSDSIYQSAMKDYAAGRVNEAIAGLERVVRAKPDNSSARFQLACLLQDVKKDYLGAICNYREFLAQDRSGEKSELAKDRIVQCERLLGPELVRKFGTNEDETLAAQNLALKDKATALEKSNRDLEKRLERALARAAESASESERMRTMLLGETPEDATRPVIVTESSLLDEEDDEKADRIKMSRDAKALLREVDEEQSGTPFAVGVRREKKTDEPAKSEELPHEPRPAEYIVQEGDTLYKLAVRFYGTRTAWQKIREANKTVISTDGRIRIGQKLILP